MQMDHSHRYPTISGCCWEAAQDLFGRHIHEVLIESSSSSAEGEIVLATESAPMPEAVPEADAVEEADGVEMETEVTESEEVATTSQN